LSWSSKDKFPFFKHGEKLVKSELALRRIAVCFKAIYYGAQITVESLNYFDDYNNEVLKLDRSTRGGYKITATLPTVQTESSVSSVYNRPSKFYIVDFDKIQTLYAKKNINVFSLEKNPYNSFEKAVNGIWYLGPLREYPSRYYISTGEIPQDVGLKGEKTATVLMIDYRRKDSLIKKLSKWVNRLEIAESAELKKSGEHFLLTIKDKNSKVFVNISDTGFGVSQILPIIVESLYAPKESTLLIEQPEIHLNPLVQSNLADFFISLAKAKSDKKQFIIETHSEHIINRIRRRIAEKDNNFSQEDVNIFYLSKEDGECKIRQLSINDYGQIEDWPDGFFEEEYTDKTAQMKAIFKNMEQEDE